MSIKINHNHSIDDVILCSILMLKNETVGERYIFQLSGNEINDAERPN